jgi:hypothetical protein
MFSGEGDVQLLLLERAVLKDLILVLSLEEDDLLLGCQWCLRGFNVRIHLTFQ